MDAVGLTDSFALVVFEHTVARTCTVENNLEPRWHAEAPRAFKLPILQPLSTLFVALVRAPTSTSRAPAACPDAIALAAPRAAPVALRVAVGSPSAPW